MLKRVVKEPGTKALLILPYVALVQEKVRWLRGLVEGIRIHPEVEGDDLKTAWQQRADHGSIKVVGFFGGGKIRSTWRDFDIGICTLEKVWVPAVTDMNSFELIPSSLGQYADQHSY